MLIQRRRRPRKRKVYIGSRQVISQGLRNSAWNDFYHRCMVMSWPGFFAFLGLAFLALNMIFATLYSFAPDAVANTRSGYFLDLFFFSFYTIAIVGYCHMLPRTDCGDMIATIEIFTGMCGVAVATGLIFARFSRPRARLVFAQNPVICRLDGQPVLMLRMANIRHNSITDARAKLWLVRTEKTQEGLQLRRSYPLALLHDESPMFILSWTVAHKIDPASPLYYVTDAELAKSGAFFVITVNGLDENFGKDVHARHVYPSTDLRRDFQYVDIISTRADGTTLVDYNKFHDIEPVVEDGAAH